MYSFLNFDIFILDAINCNESFDSPNSNDKELNYIPVKNDDK